MHNWTTLKTWCNNNYFCRKQNRVELISRVQTRNLQEYPLSDHYEELSSLSFRNLAAPIDSKAEEADVELTTADNNYEPLDLKPRDGDSSQAGIDDFTSQDDSEEKVDLMRL